MSLLRGRQGSLLGSIAIAAGAVAGAIANAIHNATGARPTAIPITSERLWRTMHAE